jgi:hypothetical protein
VATEAACSFSSFGETTSVSDAISSAARSGLLPGHVYGHSGDDSAMHERGRAEARRFGDIAQRLVDRIGEFVLGKDEQGRIWPSLCRARESMELTVAHHFPGA